MGRISEIVYCAFCKHSRRAYTKRHITTTNVVVSVLAAVLLMLAFWQAFNPRVLVLFILCLTAAEAFIQIRWRLSVKCPYCGFDPVVYVKDHEKAAEQVKTTLEAQKESADYLLSGKNPLKNLPKLKSGDKPSAQTDRASGGQLSKQV